METTRWLGVGVAGFVLGWLGHAAWSWAKPAGELDHTADATGAPSPGAARPARSGSESVFAELRGSCRWHSDLGLNSAEWWLAEQFGAPDRVRLTASRYAELEALIESIEEGLADAITASIRAGDAAIAEVDELLDRRTGGSVDAKDRALTRFRHFAERGRRLFGTSSSWGFREVRAILGDEYDEVIDRHRPAWERAADRQDELHDEAPKRIRALIESFGE